MFNKSIFSVHSELGYLETENAELKEKLSDLIKYVGTHMEG